MTIEEFLLKYSFDGTDVWEPMKSDLEELVRLERAKITYSFNKEVFAQEMSAASSIIRCHHKENGRQIPCPPMCPRQSWPESKFKRSLWTGRWKLRKSPYAS